MSWYLFKDTPAVQQRGIKVDGYQHVNRQRVNLSWGMNEKQTNKSYSPHHNQNDISTIPTTINPKIPSEHENSNTIKVLTETSDDEQEELMKLIKAQNEKKADHEVIDMFNKSRRRQQSLKGIMDRKTSEKEEKITENFQMSKRIRYLQNSLLPSCKRDSMATILDYNLNREVPLQESRVSGKSVLHNKKNQSNVFFGDGYNVFTSVDEPQKDLYQKLRDMYSYEEEYKKRTDRSSVRLG